tara:strand:- start:647 stop:1306 length:660 start_codon:yes stop_codon:yes gene_type:complete
MIKNVIFDFDGVIVDSEILIAKSLSNYLLNLNIKFGEREFFKLAGNKTIQIVSKLSDRFGIEDKDKFYNDIMILSKDLYQNKLETVSGIKNFLKNTNHKRLIGSNNTKPRILEGLKKIELNDYFNSNHIFSFDVVQRPKPDPAIYLSAINNTGININETVIIEDSSIGVQAGVAAGIKVIGLTAGSHWYEGRSTKELYDAGAYEVVKNYNDMLLLINKL